MAKKQNIGDKVKPINTEKNRLEIKKMLESVGKNKKV
jgi:hypothetical protein